ADRARKPDLSKSIDRPRGWVRMSVQGLALRSPAVLIAVWIVAATALRARGADEGIASPGTAPDATITFRGRTAAVGVGFVWGASSLDYRGKTYPVRVDGFVLGAIGTASLDGVGKVFGLSKVEDLNGDYTALSAGAALGRGSGTSVLRNDKGVRIVLGGSTT